MDGGRVVHVIACAVVTGSTDQAIGPADDSMAADGVSSLQRVENGFLSLL